MSPFHQIIELLRNELGVVLSSTLARLLLAAILGGVIGLERQLRHKPAGLRTNMFICFGAAMFTVLSNQLASTLGGDHTRIAAQIIPAPMKPMPGMICAAMRAPSCTQGPR